MWRRLHLPLAVGLALCLLIPFAGRGQIRTAKDPAIDQYLKDYARAEKERERAERQARWADPNRTLRPYLTLDEIFERLDRAALEHPDLVSLYDYGSSLAGRPLRMLKISTGPGPKARILYSANIHGNEMAGDLICLALIDFFLDNIQSDRDVAWLLERADVYVIPVLNPDGMAATVRQQAKYGTVLSLTRKNLHKVDLNRNFPYPEEVATRLNDSAGSNRKWMPNYRGQSPLSEPETIALDQLFAELGFQVHVNYHTTGGLIMSPPATFPEPLPDDDLLTAMRRDYQQAMFDPYQEHTELQFYPTIGSLDDYLYHRYGTLCVTMEVGKHELARLLLGCHNGTCSPLFWTANVYQIDQEIANNLPAAVRMAFWAQKVHADPALRQWRPAEELWVGEAPRD